MFLVQIVGLCNWVTINDFLFDGQAIEFAKEQDDEELWDDLINYSLDKPGIISFRVRF